jgi:hypothetical protein
MSRYYKNGRPVKNSVDCHRVTGSPILKKITIDQNLSDATDTFVYLFTLKNG